MGVSHVVLAEEPQHEQSQAANNDAALLALVDVTRKRLASIENQTVPSAGDRFAQYLIEGVYAVILGVTVVTWAVFGFVVWVPLLVRHTALLAGTVFRGSLFRDQVKVAHAKGCVQFAARFYGRGFEHFLAFYRQRCEPEAPVGLFEPLTAMTRGELLVECAWVAGVWSATVFAMSRAASALFGA